MTQKNPEAPIHPDEALEYTLYVVAFYIREEEAAKVMKTPIPRYDDRSLEDLAAENPGLAVEAVEAMFNFGAANSLDLTPGDIDSNPISE